MEGGAQLEAFCSAAAPVGLLQRRGCRAAPRIVPAAFGQKEKHPAWNALSRLGYPAPSQGRRGGLLWTRQDTVKGFAYAIVLGVRQRRGVTEIAFTVRSTLDHADPVADGCRIVQEALAAGYTAMLQPHLRWWKKFWNQSSVSVPHTEIERHYNLARYFYGAASRQGAPPIPLQGVWTADEGGAPPWRGEYANNLNTQLTYWPYLAANHLEAGRCFLDFFWNLLPAFRQHARAFFGTTGACIPGGMALDGGVLTGWAPHMHTPTLGAWIAHAFYLHWRYTMDRAFLAARAYPFCREIGEALAGLLQPGQNGRLQLPLSTSPEIHDNRPGAWLTPNSNFDLALLRWLFGALAEMARDLRQPDASRGWQRILEKLPPLAVADTTFDGRASESE